MKGRNRPRRRRAARMTGYNKRHWILATGLAALAGYVDAIGFLQLGGLFVSFMTGNTTRLAVGLVARSEVSLLAGGLILAFLGGVVSGALIAAIAASRRKPLVLAFVSSLLTLSALLGQADAGHLPSFIMAAAMGAANCVFLRNGEVSIGVTYMTGTLVKLGQRIAAAILGGDRFGWVPYLLLWCGLLAGAFTGASLFSLAGPASLWGGAGAAALAAVVAFSFGPAAPVPAPRGKRDGIGASKLKQ